MIARFLRAAAICLAALLAIAPATAHAQSDESATERLLQILVKNGVVTKDQAESLGKQARAEAQAAKATAHANTSQPAPTKDKPVAPGAVRVTYVPETVRKQIAAEVKQQVMQQATEEGGAEPNAIVGWTQRIRVTGDVRLRGDYNMFASGNNNQFVDFNAINGTSNGYDVNSGVGPPLLNTTADRTRARLRARLGVEATIADWVNANVRIATGSDHSPVSTNQTAGSPGDFAKYALWLDQAAIIMRPDENLTVSGGRFANPFWTSDLMYDDDLNFDGLAISARAKATRDIGGFIVAGGFPVFNTDFNLGSTNNLKTKSNDAYLFAGQVGTDWKPLDKPYSARFAIGYFNYQNVQGKESSLCSAPTSYGSCSTDGTRAPFLQFGNTVFPIRNISTLNGTSTAQPEFYGLASRFGILDVHGQTLLTFFHPIDIRPEFEFVQNLSFDPNAINRNLPVNNITGTNNAFVGSGTGYMVRVAIGHLTLDAANDWNLAVAYKYLGSDAVLDALTDSKFHLGGTNAKGFVLTGNYALDRNIWLAGAYYSTGAVSGPAYSVDTLMLDLNVRF
jgi:hypothetical protein